MFIILATGLAHFFKKQGFFFGGGIVAQENLQLNDMFLLGLSLSLSFFVIFENKNYLFERIMPENWIFQNKNMFVIYLAGAQAFGFSRQYPKPLEMIFFGKTISFNSPLRGYKLTKNKFYRL